MSKKKIISGLMAVILTLWMTVPFVAQEGERKPDPRRSNKYVYEGNQRYVEQQYEEAQKSYRKALESNPQNIKAAFNLGNAFYRTRNWDQSLASYRNVLAGSHVSREMQARTFHNTGNTLMEQKKYKEAIEEYKKSLRIDPDSYDTKYNLAYAQKMLKEDQNQQNQDQQDNQDQNKDQQHQDQKEDQQQDQNKEQQSAASQNQISRTQAEALLNAMTQQEKKVQERKNQKRGVPISREKDW